MMAALIDCRRKSGWRIALGLTLGVLGATMPVRGGAIAAYLTGNTVLEVCDAPDDQSYKKIQCLGYIIGVADALEGNVINGYRACTPASVIQGQLRDVVVKWLRVHPEKRHFVAAGLVAQALSEAFPCR